MKPLVAVVGRLLPSDRISGPWRFDAVALPRTYVDALHRSGAQEAVMLPVELDDAAATGALEPFGALVLTGGGDVDPGRYGAEPHPQTGGVVAASDAFEIALARAAVAMQLPLLAVCRGMQVLNVALGGTLHQHLPEREGTGSHGGGGESVLRHIEVAEGSRLHQVAGAQLSGACHHHQAVDTLGEGLRAVAWSDDGVVEAVERDDGWTLAVQWHPEVTAEADAVQQRLFDALVAAAAGP